MKRLFTLIITAFVFAFTASVATHNAVAQDDAATNATDEQMQHGSPVNEANKTNKDKGRKHPGHHKNKDKDHKGKHHKGKRHKKKAKSDDAGADAGK